MRWEYLGEFAYHFGVRPWEWDGMSLLDTYVLVVCAEKLREGVT